MQQGAIFPYFTFPIIEYNAIYVNIFFSILLCFFSVKCIFLPFLPRIRVRIACAPYITATKKSVLFGGDMPHKRER